MYLYILRYTIIIFILLYIIFYLYYFFILQKAVAATTAIAIVAAVALGSSRACSLLPRTYEYPASSPSRLRVPPASRTPLRENELDLAYCNYWRTI